MDEYRKDIEEIKELLKKIQKDIAQLEIKIEAEPSAEPFIFTIPEPVPSTQATAACKY